MEMIDILIGVISIIGAVLTAIVIPLIKAKVGKAKLEKIEVYVSIAVASAQQLYKVLGSGFDRKEYAIQTLKKFGVDLTDTEMDALIESAVFHLNLIIEDYRGD